MKKLLVLSLFLSICTFAFAHTINWRIGNDILSTTTCNSGDNITPPTAPEKYGYHFVKWEAYTRLEYIESTGTQWIDTGVVGNVNTAYEITTKTNEHNFNYAYVVFGSRESATQNNISCCYTYNSASHTLTAVQQFGDYRVSNQAVTATGSFIGQKLTFINSKESRSIYNWESQQTDTVTTTYSGSLTTPTNLYIGYAGSIGGLGTPSNFIGNIYSCKIWNNGTLIRDFIPVLDIAGTPCMYDRVENKFYYNQGTGQFVAGPVLNE